DDPTQGIKLAPLKTSGFRTWSEGDIVVYEAAHPIGTRARLALALPLYTALRRADLVGLGPQHIRDGVIHIRTKKTGVTLAIPVHPELARVLDAPPSGHLPFLVTKDGKPFTPAGFTNWFGEVCREVGLPRGLSAHGLRKAACRRLAEAGCSANLIASISGHRSLREVQRYTEAVDQARMARSAMEKVTRTSSVKPSYEV